jgi:hypothetical protein
VALVKGEVVLMVQAAVTVMLKIFAAEPPAFVAFAVKLNTPAVVGVPLMIPLD